MKKEISDIQVMSNEWHETAYSDTAKVPTQDKYFMTQITSPKIFTRITTNEDGKAKERETIIVGDNGYLQYWTDMVYSLDYMHEYGLPNDTVTFGGSLSEISSNEFDDMSLRKVVDGMMRGFLQEAFKPSSSFYKISIEEDDEMWKGYKSTATAYIAIDTTTTKKAAMILADTDDNGNVMCVEFYPADVKDYLAYDFDKDQEFKRIEPNEFVKAMQCIRKGMSERLKKDPQGKTCSVTCHVIPMEDSEKQ